MAERRVRVTVEIAYEDWMDHPEVWDWQSLLDDSTAELVSVEEVR